MEQQARHALELIKNTNVQVDAKIDILAKLNSSIKRQHVPELAISICFQVVRVAISMPQLLETGFSILSHLTRRLVSQNQHSMLATQGPLIYSCLTDRLGDAKAGIRDRAVQALADFWPVARTDVEEIVRDTALTSKNPKTKESGMELIKKMHQNPKGFPGFQFRRFVFRLVDCLEDADGSVRDAAKRTIINLFQSAPEHAKSDLNKQMEQSKVRKATVAYICDNLPPLNCTEPDLSSSTRSIENEVPTKKHVFSGTTTSEKNYAPPASSIPGSTADNDQIEPLYISTRKELEEICSDMLPHFEGKESEQNWTHREKCILQLRRITKGNSPADHRQMFIHCIKTLLDGILKTVNSLRTTVSTNGCSLVKEVARAAYASDLDSMVEVLLQSLIKLCGGTKKISADNANSAMIAMFNNASYNIRLTQHIWNACQDKNVRPRDFATGWLKTLIYRHADERRVFDHSGGLELIEKCIKRGLADANPLVREGMRSTYWEFDRVWPERSANIMGSLDAKQRDQLRNHCDNPDYQNIRTRSPSPAVARAAPLKEIIYARKQASVAELKPPKPLAMVSNTLKTGSLSSAPVRPIRKLKAIPSSNNLIKENVPLRPKTPVTATPNRDRHTTIRPKTPNIATEATNEDTPFRPNTATATSSYNTTRSTRDITSRRPKTPAPSPSHASPAPAIEKGFLKDLPLQGNKSAPSTGHVSPPTPTEVFAPPERGVLKELPLQDNKPAPSPNRVSPPFTPFEVLASLDRGILKELPLQDNRPTPSGRNSPPPPIDVLAKVAEVDKPNLAFKMLESGIIRIQSGTLDVHGFRKVQDLIRNGEEILQDASMFQELTLSLLVKLEAPNDAWSTSFEKGRADLRTQVLVTLRLLLSQKPQDFQRYLPLALCSVIRTRRYYSSKDHMSCLLEEAMEEMIDLTEYQDVAIQVVLELLEKEANRGYEGDRPTLNMGILGLSSLLKRNTRSSEPGRLTTEMEMRLVELALDGIKATDAMTRRSVVPYVLEVHDQIRSDSRFWKLMSPASDDSKNLLTYYLEKRTH